MFCRGVSNQYHTVTDNMRNMAQTVVAGRNQIQHHTSY